MSCGYIPYEGSVMSTIIFTDKEFDECKNFSELVDTSLYAKRNQWDAEKRKADSLVGKLGEVAVYNVLSPKYTDLTYPDFKIYKPREKSWDFDMKSSSFNLHVKTQESLQSAKFGESWIFQHGGGKRKHYDKEIFDRVTPNQYVAFVKVNLQKREAEVRAIVSLDLLHDNNLFALPVLEKLQNANKLAVYYKDLQQYGTELWKL